MATLADLIPGLDRGGIARPGRHLSWLTAGHGDPPVVVVPGAGETALDRLPVLPSLAALSTVVAIDRAGLGASDPDPAVSVTSQVDDLAAVLARTGPGVVVGHSWGGLLAQLVALRRPGDVVGLVLVDPSHEELFAQTPPHLRLVVAAMGPVILAARLTGVLPRLIRTMGRRLAAVSTMDADVRTVVEEEYVRSYRHWHQAAMIGRENRLAQGSVAEVRRARGAAVLPDVPMVVLIASTGKPATLQRRSTELLSALAGGAPQGRAIVVEAGHYIHHDRPEAVIEAVRSVLAHVRGG